TALATGRRRRVVRAVLMAAAVIPLVAVVYSQVVAKTSTESKSLTGGYFKAVNKGDNTETRAKLWSQAVEQIRHGPVVRSGFTGDVSLPVNLNGEVRKVPPHNDFLQVAMGGGLVGLGLLLWWIV